MTRRVLSPLSISCAAICSILIVSQMSTPAFPAPVLQYDRIQAVLEGFYVQDTSPPTTIAAGDQAPFVSDGVTKGDALIPIPLPTKPVSLPVDAPTKGFWTHSPGANELAREGAEGEVVRDADVVVVGSGLTGVSAAYHLARKIGKGLEGERRRVVVLEARDFCSGATGRNGGHLFPNPFYDFSRRQALYGTEEAVKSFEIEQYTYREFVKILHDTNTSAEVDLVEGGHITLFVTPQEEKLVRADYEAAKKAGVPEIERVRFIDRETMAKTRGTAHPGVWTPSANLWPLKLAAQIYKLAKKASSSVEVTLHTHTPATAVRLSEGNRRYTVETPRGPIECDYVVHAANAYTNYLVDPQETKVRVVPTRGQVIAVPAKAGTEEVGANGWGANEGFEYWFPRPVKKEGENPVIFLGGGREVAKPNYEYYETDDGKVNGDVGASLRRFLPSVFPGLFDEDTEPTWEWTGIMGYTATGNPYVGRLPSKDGAPSHQYIAAGYTGHGMPRTYACAEVVAGMISSDMAGSEWTAPSWFPRHYEWNRQ
ncbi:FAD dependent oxidoreductase-domain-containing protein [Ephemerocybe angulata]|uniref:FAD dependent oxidoreductase-domain-containing protein n=1 Tax=Ephemerocybe angulata TaxID=980116 RepID=A0A8H6MA05_9AGAR|nr:FAD dependent oxidoreductase-domain-containing protein [Tulosesus angulatus]